MLLFNADNVKFLDHPPGVVLQYKGSNTLAKIDDRIDRRKKTDCTNADIDRRTKWQVLYTFGVLSI